MTQIGEIEQDPRMLEVLKATVESKTGTYMQTEKTKEDDDWAACMTDADVRVLDRMDKYLCRRLHAGRCRIELDGDDLVKLTFFGNVMYEYNYMEYMVVVERRKDGWWVSEVAARVYARTAYGYDEEKYDEYKYRSQVALMTLDAQLRKEDRKIEATKPKEER